MSYQPNNRTPLLPSKSHVISAYSSKPRSHSIIFPEISPFTRQEFKDECDINTLMARYIRTNEMPHVNILAPQYFDAAGVDFHTHMNAVAEAKSLFAQLPSSVRNRFRNDPGHFIDFCSDPGNRKEMAEMGLLSPSATREALRPSPPSAPPASAPPAPPAAPPASPSGAAPSNGAA